MFSSIRRCVWWSFAQVHCRAVVANDVYIEFSSTVELVFVFVLQMCMLMFTHCNIYPSGVHVDDAPLTLPSLPWTHGTRVQPTSLLMSFASFECRLRGEWRGMSLPSDANTETVTYGGLVNSACHGTGKTQARHCCLHRKEGLDSRYAKVRSGRGICCNNSFVMVGLIYLW